MRCVRLSAFVILLCVSTSMAQNIHTIAGGGPGSGITALSANLNQPIRVVCDTAGNVYFTAYGQHRVFKVDSAGVLSVVAGTGLAGFSGDNGAATSARRFFNPRTWTCPRGPRSSAWAWRMRGRARRAVLMRRPLRYPKRSSSAFWDGGTASPSVGTDRVG
jgi:hypothetical protein